MNQTFSVSRFGRLLRKYFIDSRGQLLANLGLLMVVLLAVAFILYSGNPLPVSRNRVIPFFFIGWAAWYVFIWQQTEALNHKERAMTYLMQPASQLEKIGLIWLVSGAGFVVVYCLLFGLVDVAGVQYVNSREWPAGTPVLEPYYYTFEGFKPNLWVLTVLLHPFALVFLLVVRRYSLPSVAILTFLLIFLGIILNSLIMGSLIDIGEGNRIAPFDRLGVPSPINKKLYRLIDLPQPIGNQIRYAVGLLAVVILYITAYFRLKEREV
ncbi:hypothetical protein [Spirosoma linguale]|uniref:Uncharacterized protein n=1 Tax=Spirosoma linguale (strain ATCC 33905 / DSM 74 / LMG 10896 / Claus 1) TaxID=504472 RepID=D2QK50_SPILD|nr:hypothetical protein Slin_1121 [Spirosoma linguale DSM 74]